MFWISIPLPAPKPLEIEQVPAAAAETNPVTPSEPADNKRIDKIARGPAVAKKEWPVALPESLEKRLAKKPLLRELVELLFILEDASGALGISSRKIQKDNERGQEIAVGV